MTQTVAKPEPQPLSLALKTDTLVYAELRKLAHHYLREERPGHLLQSTALVHEAFVRMVGMNPPTIEDRTHFFGIAAKLMRDILVEYARARQSKKRGGGDYTLTLDETIALPHATDVNLLLLDEALNELSRLDGRQSRIIELRFFLPDSPLKRPPKFWAFRKPPSPGIG